MPEAVRVPLPGAGAEASAPAQGIKNAHATFMKSTGNPAFEKLFAKVQKEFEAAEKKLPPGPDGKPASLGLPDEFIGKLVRRVYDTSIGSKFIDELVAEVVKAIRAGHGPARRNRVAMAAMGAQKEIDAGQVSTRPDPTAWDRRSVPV